MDMLPSFLLQKIPVGRWVNGFVEFLTDNFDNQFRLLSEGLEWMILGTVDLLNGIPPLLLIAVAMAIGYFVHRKIAVTVLLGVALLLIQNLGYWTETMETVALVLYATFLAILIGVPVGVLAARRRWVFVFLRPILDLMQTIPTFVYLIPTLMLFGLGMVPGLISTVIFAIPAPIRLTYLGLTGVPEELVEAGRAFGATPLQLLTKVELPLAMPSLMAGVTQCIMLSLSMVVIAALVGADGLGKPVIRALNTVNMAQGFEAGLAIVIVAIVLDRLLKQPARKGVGQDVQ